MYNLIEYSTNYRKTRGSFWNYYRDEPNSGVEKNISYSIKDSKSFNCKTSITGKLEGDIAEKEDVEIFVPLKYLTNFWRTLGMSSINCEVSLTLTLFNNCVITSKARRRETSTVTRFNNPKSATFTIKDTKLYVPVVTLSATKNRI